MVMGWNIEKKSLEQQKFKLQCYRQKQHSTRYISTSDEERERGRGLNLSYQSKYAWYIVLTEQFCTQHIVNLSLVPVQQNFFSKKGLHLGGRRGCVRDFACKLQARETERLYLLPGGWPPIVKYSELRTLDFLKQLIQALFQASSEFWLTESLSVVCATERVSWRNNDCKYAI